MEIGTGGTPTYGTDFDMPARGSVPTGNRKIQSEYEDKIKKLKRNDPVSSTPLYT